VTDQSSPQPKKKKLFIPVFVSALILAGFFVVPQLTHQSIAQTISETTQAVTRIVGETIKNGKTLIFKEARQWQVASDAITYVGTASDNTDNATDPDVDVDVSSLNIQADDVVIFFGSVDGTAGYALPPGFTMLMDVNTSGSHNNRMAYKIATTSDQSYFVDPVSGDERGIAIFMVYRGIDTNDPIAATSSNTGGSDTTGVISSITPDVDNSVVVACVGMESGNSGSPLVDAWPGSITERNDNVNGPPGNANASSAGACGDHIQTTATAVSGNITINSGSGTTYWGTMAVALNPAPEGGGGSTNIQQNHFRWRDDSAGLNTNSGWIAGEDVVATTTLINTPIRLRMGIDNATTSATSTGVTYQLEYAQKVGVSCTGGEETFATVPVSATAGVPFEMATSSQYADQASTTAAYLTASSTTCVDGYGVEDPSNTTGGQDIDTDSYTELEYAIKATQYATSSEYCFRVTDAGDDSGITYIRYPELQLLPDFKITSSNITVTPAAPFFGASTAISAVFENVGANYTNVIGGNALTNPSGVGAKPANFTMLNLNPGSAMTRNGTIKKWSVCFSGTAVDTVAKFKVFRVNGANYDYVGQSSQVNIDSGSGCYGPYETDIEVQAGDLTGIWFQTADTVTGAYVSQTALAGGLNYVGGDVTVNTAISGWSNYDGYMSIRAYGDDIETVVWDGDPSGSGTPLDATTTIETLAYGATTSIDIDWTPTATGTTAIYATIDDRLMIGEADETNNVASTSVDVLAAYLSHFRWRDDTASLSSDSGWIGVEDIAATISTSTEVTRLRVTYEVAGVGSTTNIQHELQYAEKLGLYCSDDETYYPVPISGNATTTFEMATSTQYTNYASTTNSILSSFTFTMRVDGYALEDPSNSTPGYTTNADEYTEFEFAIRPYNLDELGGNYCFRIDDPSDTVAYTYSVYPEIKVGWCENWAYYKDVDIGNAFANTYTDLQVEIEVDTASLISGGKLQSNCADLRFADVTTGARLAHWFEPDTCNTATTLVWVKVPELAASATTTIRMYYDNSTASQGASGDSTFVHFDDFENNNFDRWDSATNWTIDAAQKKYGTYSGRSGTDWGDVLSITDAFSLERGAVEGWVRMNETNLNHYPMNLNLADSNREGYYAVAGSGGDWRYWNGSVLAAYPNASSYSSATWYSVKFVFDFTEGSNGKQWLWIDGTEQSDSTGSDIVDWSGGTGTAFDGWLLRQDSGGGYYWVDNLQLRELYATSTEPGYSIGTESACVPPTGITISGNVYDYGTTNALAECDADTGTHEIAAFYTNGSVLGTASCDETTGAFSIENVGPPLEGAGIVIYINGESTYGATVTRYDGDGDSTGHVVWDNAVRVTSDDATAVTNSNMDAYDNGNDADIPYTVTSGNLSVEDGIELYVTAGKTYAPGGTITTSPSASAGSVDGDIYVPSTATLNAGANVVSVGGDLKIYGGTYTTIGTTIFTATATGHSASSTSFANITFNGSGGGWSFPSDVTITGDLTVSTGTLSGTNDITVNGNVSGAGTINLTGGEFTHDIAQSRTFGSTSGSNDWTFNNLTFSSNKAQGTSSSAVLVNASLNTDVSGQRSIVRTSTGILYAVVSDLSNNDVEVWKSSDNGQSWAEQDAAGKPNYASLMSQVEVTIDSNDILHVIYAIEQSAMYYATFNTADAASNQDTWQTGPETIRGGDESSSGRRYVSIVVDSNDIPHVAFDQTNGGQTTLYYANRIGGTWSVSTLDVNGWRPQLEIGDEDVPEIVYSDFAEGVIRYALGDANDPSSFNTYDLDTLKDYYDRSGIDVDDDGNTHVTYVNKEGEQVVRTRLDGSAYNVWQPEELIKSGGTFGGDIVAVGNTRYVFVEYWYDGLQYYEDSLGYWRGPFTLMGGQTVTSDFSVRGAYLNNYKDEFFIDYLYIVQSSGDLYWDVLDVSALVSTANAGGTGDINVAGVLKIGEAADVNNATTTLNAGNRTWNLLGTGGDPFQIYASQAAFFGSTSVFAYVGNNTGGNTTIESASYGTLQLNNGSETFVTAATTTASTSVIVSAGTLSVGSGNPLIISGDLTVNGTLSGAGNVTVQGSVLGSGIVSMTSGSTFFHRVLVNESFGTTSGSNDWSFHDLTFGNASSDDTSFRAVNITSGNTNRIGRGGRVIVRDSDGDLFVVVEDTTDGAIEIWKSTDNGETWVEQDTSNNPDGTDYTAPSIAIDSNDLIHIAYWDPGGGIIYATFSATTSTFVSDTRLVVEAAGTSNPYTTIAIDGDDHVHIVYTDTFSGYETPIYLRNVNGWEAEWLSSYCQVVSVNCRYPHILISKNNEYNDIDIPIIGVARMNSTIALYIGDKTDPDNYSGQSTNPAEPDGDNTLSLAEDSKGNVYVGWIADNTNLMRSLKSYGQTWASGIGGDFINDGTRTYASPSVAVSGDDVYILAEQTVDGLVELHKVRDSATSTAVRLSGSADFQEVRTKYATYNNHFSDQYVDFVYSNGSNIFYDRIDVPKHAAIVTDPDGSGGIEVTNTLQVSDHTQDEVSATTTLDLADRTWILSATATDTPFVMRHFHLDTGGTETSYGSLIGSSSTVVFSGNYGGGNTKVQYGQFNNVTFNNTSETFDLTDNFTTDGDLTITNGTVDASTSTLDIGGDLSVAGTLLSSRNITVRGGDVTGNGTITQTSGLFSVFGSGAFGGSGTWTLAHLLLGDGSTAATTTGSGSGTVAITKQGYQYLYSDEDSYYGTVYSMGGQPFATAISNGGWGDVYYGYVKYNIDDGPSSAYTGNVQACGYLTGPSNADPQTYIRRVTGDWTESSISSVSTTTDTTTDQYALADPHLASQYDLWCGDISSFYKGWKDSTYTNYGIKYHPTFTTNAYGNIYASDRSTSLQSLAYRSFLAVERKVPFEIASNHVLNAGSLTWDIAGAATGTSPFKIDGTFNADTSTVIYSATTSPTIVATTTYYDLTVGTSVSDYGSYTFFDNFDSGTTTKWDTLTESSGSLIATSTSRFAGGYATAASSSAGAGEATLSYDTNAALTTGYARFYMYFPNDWTMQGGAFEEVVIHTITDTSFNNRYLLSVEYQSSTEETRLFAKYYTSTQSENIANTGSAGVLFSKGEWHLVEVKSVISTGSGELTVWLDGEEVISVTGVNTGDTELENVNLGLLYVSNVTDQWFYLDEFAFDNTRIWGIPTYQFGTSTPGVTQVINGTLTIGYSGTPAICDASTLNTNLDVGGVTINASSTLLAATSSDFTIAGDWTNNGWFHNNNATTTFDGSTQQVLSGSMIGTNAFYALIFTNNSGSDPDTSPSIVFENAASSTIFKAETASTKFRFQASNGYTFTNFFINGQATGSRVQMRSSSGGSAWFLYVTGTQSVQYANPQDSNADGGTEIDASDGTSLDGTGNTNWNFGAVPTITVSGTAYNDGTFDPLTECDADTGTYELSLRVEGTTYTASCDNTTGDYSFTSVIQPATSAGMVIWMNNIATVGSLTTVYDGSGDSVGNLIWDDSVEVTSDDATAVTNAHMDVYDNSDDPDIPYTVTSNNLIVEDGSSLYVRLGKTYAPGGTVTTSPSGVTASSDGDVLIGGGATMNMGTYALSVGGDFLSTGTLTHTGTTTFTATGSGFLASSTSFANVEFAGINGAWRFADTTTTVNGNMTIDASSYFYNDGDTIITGDILVNGSLYDIAGSLSIQGGDMTGSGVVSFTTSTTTIDGTGNFGGNTPWTFYILVFGDGSGVATTTKSGTGTTTVSNILSVASNQVFDAGTATWNIAGIATPFMVNGTFIASSSTFSYSASSSANVIATRYYNLEFRPTEAYPTYTLLAGAFVIDNNFILGPRSMNVMVNTYDPTVDVNGSFFIYGGNYRASDTSTLSIAGDYYSAGAFHADNGTTTFDGTTQQTLSGVMSNFYPFYTLNITNNSGSDPDTSPSVIFASAASSTNFFAQTAGTSVRFQAGSGYTFTNFYLNGQSIGSRVALRSSTPSAPWLLYVTGTQSVQNTDVRDSDASAGDTIDASNGTSLDSTGNTNWNFGGQYLSFSLSTTQSYFGFLTAGSARYASSSNPSGSATETVAHTMTASTTASNGYTITVRGGTLTSGSNTLTAIGDTAASSTPGSEQFGMRVEASGGSGQVASPYNLLTSYAYNATAGSTDIVATTAGTSEDTTYSVYFLSNIASQTEAGQYSTTITYVITANF
jgi:hypothetical protein